MWLSCLQGRQLSGEQGYLNSPLYPASLALQPRMYTAELHCMESPSVSAQQKSTSLHEPRISESLRKMVSPGSWVYQAV